MIKLITICILVYTSVSSQAEDFGSNTGYKLPRFLSIKSEEVNMRVGSSINYPIILQFIIKNMPIEITDEYDAWRKVKDIEGNEGWIHKSLLKGDRFAITNQPYETMAQIYRKPQGEVIGSIGKKNIVKINSCLTKWCKIEYGKYKGWMNKKNLWGVYKKEKINVPFYQQLINFYWSII